MEAMERPRLVAPQETRPTPEELSDYIGKIYDCALDPSKWESVLSVLCRAFAFSSAMMGVARFPADPFVLASIGVEPELLRRLPDFGADMAALWGGWERLQNYPLDEPIINSQAMPGALLQDNAYMAHWLARGVTDAAVVIMARDATMFGNVGFNRHGSAGPIGDRETDGLRLLAPHFRRAVTISNLFDMKRVETATFSNVLDSFGFGVVLVDINLSIVHANTAAADLLAARDALRSTRNVLSLPHLAAHEALERAVRHAAGDNAQMGARGIGIPAPRQNGEACIIHVLPLKRGSLGHVFGQRVAAALFVTQAAAPRRLPIDALALLYDLTPAEIRVLDLIANGRSRSDAAKLLGIGESTVKTHLIHLFQKTGCKRQTELVKLVADLSLAV